MKWPIELTLVRHDVSEYNALKELKKMSLEYQLFRRFYDREVDPTMSVSSETRIAAALAAKAIGLGISDVETDLANAGADAVIVGQVLQHEIELPNVIFVSPYKRTRLTLERLIEGWPKLGEVQVIEDDRIREQEHGLDTVYNDKYIFWALHPEQRAYAALYGKMSRYWYRYIQGENVPDVRERVRSFLTTLIRDFNGQRVLVVSHHLAILSFRANLERLSAEQFVDLDEHDKPINVGVTRYVGRPTMGKDGRLELDYYNRRLY